LSILIDLLKKVSFGPFLLIVKYRIRRIKFFRQSDKKHDEEKPSDKNFLSEENPSDKNMMIPTYTKKLY